MLRPLSSRLALAVSLIPLTILAACSKAEFTGDAGKRAIDPPKVIEKTVTLGCDASDATQVIELDARDTLSLKLGGEFCPTATNDLTVLFVLDASGSMGKHYEQSTNQLSSGNDPRVGDACGRLAAVNAILGQLQADTGVVSNVGVVTFAGGVVAARAPQSMTDFAASLDADLACNFVSQGSRVGYHPENPGAVRASVDASTNYASALDAASDMLANVPGRKVIYFVSDGMPTSGGSNPVAAGVDAGARLRGLTDVTVNGLLLGQSGAAAKSVMTSVVGSADRVRLAGSAGELATEITKFPAPTLDEKTLSASVTLDGDERSLGVSAKGGSTPGAFGYETAAVELGGTPGSDGEMNVVLRVGAKSLDGQELSASKVVTIKRF
jgi:hypothetical protein